MQYLLALILVISCDGCYAQTGYRLDRPDTVYRLPEVLREISGITVIDSVRTAAVQDEEGVIYILNRDKIMAQYAFGPGGDYEGIANAGQDMYILRSDGILFEVADYASKKRKMQTFITGIPASNNEGLCYDVKNDRLLIASKSKPGKGPLLKNLREIYAFDLSSKKLSPTPVIVLNIEDVKAIASHKKIKLPVKVKKNGVAEAMLRFTASAIAMHPVNEMLYLISSSDRLLFVFDEAGKIVDIIPLNSLLFNKPEGIIFHSDGKMIITNEGQGGQATILEFDYRK